MDHVQLTWEVTMETDLVRASANGQHVWHGCGRDCEGQLSAAGRRDTTGEHYTKQQEMVVSRQPSSQANPLSLSERVIDKTANDT